MGGLVPTRYIMRKFLIVTVTAATAAFSFGASAYADSVTVTTRHSDYHRPHHRTCYVKTVKHRDRHGHIVVRKTRVCR
jgi:hypothetical protein